MYGVDDFLHLQTNTSPAEDTSIDSVRDIAIEQRCIARFVIDVVVCDDDDDDDDDVVKEDGRILPRLFIA
jgi:hypothetical protein